MQIHFRRKTFIRIIQWLIILYALVGITLYYLQDQIIFRSVALPKNYVFTFPKPFKEINLPYDKDANINIIQFTVADSVQKGVVLYFHGNMKNINYYARLADVFLENDYEVWMVDYPGYGKSTGEMKEEYFYAYAEQLYKLAARNFAADSIVLYGKSLGSGIAAYIASRYPARRLVLETPYYSFPSMASTYFPVYPVKRMLRFEIPTYQYLENLKIPVTIFHGTADRTIPLKNALKLQPLLKPSDQFIIIEKAKHNGISDLPEYRSTIDSLLQ